jgi:murein DD-endopeptidase MepM/ murein hydrolase activator NlpD
VSSGSRPGRWLALGWLLLAACAGGRAGQPAGPLPAWARAQPSATHAEPEVVRGVHRVEKGDTWFHIARAYGLTADELAKANGLEVTTPLTVGMQLTIPGPVESSAGATASGEHPTTEPAGPPPGAKAWETAVEPRAGQPLPAELLRAFEAGNMPAVEGPVPPELARAFDHPTEPMPHPVTPPAPPPPAEKSTAVSASIGPPPPGAPANQRPSATAGRPPLGARPTAATALAGTLQWPLRGVLYARFGKKGREPHDGIDLAAPAGTPVKTAGEGVVLFAGPQSGYGLIVVVGHERGLVTVYAHSRDLRVRTGQSVRPGQVIATVGESGKTSGPHLHFEVRVDGEPVDPVRFLGPVPAP